jgi:hypothetical protein
MIEQLVAAALGLDHRELDPDVGEGQQRVDEPTQVLDVVLGDHAIDREIEPASGQVAHRRKRGIERVAADHEVVNLASTAVQREVHVAQPAFDQLLDDLGIGRWSRAQSRVRARP